MSDDSVLRTCRELDAYSLQVRSEKLRIEAGELEHKVLLVGSGLENLLVQVKIELFLQYEDVIKTYTEYIKILKEHINPYESETLWECEQGLPSGTSFCIGYGERGLQLTDGNGYVVISFDKIPFLIKQLKKIIKKEGKT